MFCKKKLLCFLLLLFFAISPVIALNQSALTIAEIIQITLQKNPDILLQQEAIRSKRGEFTQTRASFETILTSRISYKDDATPLSNSNRASLGGTSFLRSGSANVNLGASKTLRNGTVLSQQIDLSGSESGLRGVKPENRANIIFQISHPLGRNRGRNNRANVHREAALLELEAEMISLRITINQKVYQAVQAYWAYSGACQNLRIREQAKERALRLASETEILIKADERPASERSQIIANLASRKAECIGAKAQVRQARRNLGLILGIDSEAIERLSFPDFTLPGVKDLEIASSVNEAEINRLMNLRPEMENIKLRIKAAKRRVAGSRNLEKPQMNLNLFSGYNGFEQKNGMNSFFTPMSNRIPGANFGISFETEFPQKNHQARGLRMQYQSAENSLGISLSKIKREIKSGLYQAFNLVHDQVQQVNCSSEAVKAYEQAVKNENEKLAQGFSTIVDLLYVEDRLTSAMVSDLQARVELANAINSLIYESAHISSNLKDEKFLIQTNNFLEVPEVFRDLKEKAFDNKLMEKK
jgi:outer membrane protein TolC